MTATTASTASTATPDALSLYDGQWKQIQPGIEQMNVRGRVGQVDELLALVRLDVSRVTLKVLYDPGNPKYVRDWVHFTNAAVVINGGFFDEAKRATALVIVDGVAAGKSYSGFGGMFTLRGNAPSMQWLKTKPYRPDPSIDFALQSFPMLVLNGKTTGSIQDNGMRNRRSFVGIDAQGRVILGVCQFAQWSLTELAQYLDANAELQLVHALNLDGGESTGLWVRGALDATLTDSIDSVPQVIAGWVK
jgi:hypothetical protein